VNRAAAEQALSAYRPGVDGPWGAAEAGHLLRRARFGGTLDERRALEQAGPEPAVESVTRLAEPQGEWAATLAALAPLDGVEELRACQGAWLTRLIRDPDPIRERLALFWHGHFATSVEKVGRTRLMVAQIETLRALGPGSFAALVDAVSRDPAMITWLDGNANRRHHPNENFARELMELFTLGLGHYDERDVLEAARAFTGWHEQGDRFRFDEHEHDEGDKQVLGRRGPLGGEDVLAACLEQPACARHVGGRIFREFVRDDPEPELLDALAELWRALDLDTLALLRHLLASRVFYEPRSRRALVKSPVAFAVGAARSLGLRPAASPLAERLSALGQSLFAPPSVKGWDGGRSWINAATLVGRVNLAGELAAQAAASDGAGSWAPDERPDLDRLGDLLLDGPLPAAVAGDLGRRRLGPAGALQVVLSLPEYQLA